MFPPIRNLFEAVPDAKEELVLPLIQASGYRLEHIVSNGASSPPDFWYEQDAPEWVALIQGRAILEFEEGRLQLKAGDSMVIPSHLRHRVAQTSVDAVWIAMHFTDNVA